MYLRKLLPIVVFVFALPVCGFAQEKVTTSSEQKVQTVVDQDKKEKPKSEAVKAVPPTNKNLEAMKLQNRKATLEQMHTINKAIRKSMTVHKRR